MHDFESPTGRRDAATEARHGRLLRRLLTARRGGRGPADRGGRAAPLGAENSGDCCWLRRPWRRRRSAGYGDSGGGSAAETGGCITSPTVSMRHEYGFADCVERRHGRGLTDCGKGRLRRPAGRAVARTLFATPPRLRWMCGSAVCAYCGGGMCEVK